MIKVAIAGNIACGKSTVEQIILDFGYKVIDTDKVNHYILNNDSSAINEIKQTFKTDDILDENANISREKLGKVVFSSMEKKVQLEEILHKRIFDKVNDFFLENNNEKVVFVSIPLLFESKKEKLFDKIIFISADEETRLKRLMKRNNYSEEYARIRINSQEKEDEKILKSDYVVYNNSDLDGLKKQVEKIIKYIIN